MKTKARCWLVLAGYLYSVKTGEVRAAPVPPSTAFKTKRNRAETQKCDLKTLNEI